MVVVLGGSGRLGLPPPGKMMLDFFQSPTRRAPLGLVLSAASALWACTPEAPPPEPPTPEAVTSGPLRGLLLNDGFSEDQISVTITRRELGLWFVQAEARRPVPPAPDAPPLAEGEVPPMETAVYTLVADGSWRSYGRHGVYDLADLARSEDWWGRRPEVKDVLAVLDFAVYDHALLVEGKRPYRWETGLGELELHFFRLDSADAKDSRGVKVLFPRSGAMEVKEESR